jgi:transcriptional regulator with XRE-family HTH domain
MSANGLTFGIAITKARKALGLSQKKPASRVMKEEGGGSLFPQHLNDIEYGRRSLSSGQLIRQFSGILNIPGDYLCTLAGRLPEDLRPYASSPDKVVANFRKALKEQRQYEDDEQPDLRSALQRPSSAIHAE